MLVVFEGIVPIRIIGEINGQVEIRFEFEREVIHERFVIAQVDGAIGEGIVVVSMQEGIGAGEVITVCRKVQG